MAQKVDGTWVRRLMPFYRVAVLAAIVLLARAQHAKFKASRGGVAIDLVAVQQILPEAAGLAEGNPVKVLNAGGEEIGMAIRTSPASDVVVGYAGPTDALVVFDAGGRVAGVRILESADTTEHVGDVLQDQRFMESFSGLTWGELGALNDIDAVSGSTLTSMAIAEGIVLRVAGSRPSLRFPEDVTLEELKKLFPEAAEFEEDKGVALREVTDASGTLLGYFVRTSPYSDDVVGYQGPTDVLVGFDPGGKITKFRVLNSYDNEPYVGDLRYEPAFFKVFAGMLPPEVAKIVPEEDGIEGVSGATMTSWAVAQSIVERSKAMSVPKMEEPKFERRVSVHEWGTIGVMLVGCLVGFTRLRGKKWVRLLLQLLVVGYLGLVTGNLVAQSLYGGWATGSVPWRAAPGLVLLGAAALVLPWAARRNIYCQQVCPHGAAQLLVNRMSPWKKKLNVGKKLDRFLKWIPAILLVLVVAVLMRVASIDLAAIEPFDAWLIGIGGAASITIAVAGLVLSAFTSQPYCKYGCPTGALLEFVRSKKASERFSAMDGLAGLMVVGAAVVVCL